VKRIIVFFSLYGARYSYLNLSMPLAEQVNERNHELKKLEQVALIV